MALVAKVLSQTQFKFTLNNNEMLFILATGEVNTSGWSSPRLSPYFYVSAPSDGIWDFDFEADAPIGPVLNIKLPVVATTVVAAPPWIQGVRIHGEAGPIHTLDFKTEKVKQAPPAKDHRKAAPKGSIILTFGLASYDDSIQPTGNTKYDPWPHAEMKKLHHNLTLVVTGPDEAKIRSCFSQAATAGLVAAIVAAYATGGLGLSAATQAFLAALTGCLGNGFVATIRDKSEWVYWWT